MNISQRERMLKGELYLASDPELKELEIVHVFFGNNSICFSKTSRRTPSNTSRLVGKIETGVWIEPPFYCDYGQQIELADGVCINMNRVFWAHLSFESVRKH